MDPDTLGKTERALWRAFPRGESLDLSRATGKARMIRAEVIAALLLGAVPAEPGRIAALRLNGAKVTGALALGHAQIPGPVRLRNCEFDSAVDLAGARTRDLDLEGSRFPGLNAALAEIDGNLSLARCGSSGEVVLTGAHVTGTLDMHGTRLRRPGAVALAGNRIVIDDDLYAVGVDIDGELRLAGARVGGSVMLMGAAVRNEGGRALYAPDMTVGARFLARDGFSACGEVRLATLRITGDLSFQGAVLSNPGGNALLAYGVQASQSVTLSEGFRAEGAVRLSRSKIGGAVDLDIARLENVAGDAIRCRNTQARTLHFGPGLETSGIVDFRSSQFANIHTDPASLPAQPRLSGLGYDEMTPRLPATTRVSWLRRDVDGYLPQNYETLAAMYRRHGDDTAARTVLLARERERRMQLPWYGRAWSLLQEVTVGYGYRPLRAGAWLAAFLVLGTVAFGLHHPPPLRGEPHPAFNPLVYTLDLLVPVVNFGLRGTYDPQGMQQWLAYLFIAAGWIFVTTIAAGIARVLRRQ